MPLKPRPPLSMETALAIVNMPVPEANDSAGWRSAQAALETWAREQRGLVLGVLTAADTAKTMAKIAEARAQREQAFTTRVEQGRACLPAWKQPPKAGTEFEVVDVLDGFFYVRGIVPNADTPWRYSTRTGRHNYRGADAGVLDVPATFLAWRQFCAARKAKAQET